MAKRKKPSKPAKPPSQPRGRGKEAGTPSEVAEETVAEETVAEAVEADAADARVPATAESEAVAETGMDVAAESGSAEAVAETGDVPAAEALPAIEIAYEPPAPSPYDGRAPFLVLADYEQRSLAHVAGLPEQLDAPGLWRGVAYRIGARRLASGFTEVVEILPLPSVTPVPGTQPWMLGVANVRGSLLPVVDLKQFLEGERTVLNESQRVLVVRQSGGDVAVTIDELYGQRSFVDGQLADVASLAEGRYAHFVERAYSVNEQDWGVFSLDRLSRTPEFRQATT